MPGFSPIGSVPVGREILGSSAAPPAPDLSFGTSFNQPIFLKSRHALRAAFFWPDPFPIQNYASLTFTWLQPLSIPNRRRELPLAQRLPPLAFGADPFVAMIRWYPPLSTPVLPKSRHAVFERSTSPTPVIVPYAWRVPFSLPVRRKRTWDYLKAQEPFAFGGFLQDLPFGWFVRMDEPTRPKLELGARYQPAENTMYIYSIFPFAQTGPLYVNSRGGRGQAFWRGRTS